MLIVFGVRDGILYVRGIFIYLLIFVWDSFVLFDIRCCFFIKRLFVSVGCIEVLLDLFILKEWIRYNGCFMFWIVGVKIIRL